MKKYIAKPALKETSNYTDSLHYLNKTTALSVKSTIFLPVHLETAEDQNVRTCLQVMTKNGESGSYLHPLHVV